MKYYQGIPVNIEQPVLGRLIKTYHHIWFNRKRVPWILAVTEPKQTLPKADAYIISGFLSSPASLRSPYIYGLSLDAVLELNEGDVLFLSQDGRINVVYEINSCHNAILVTNRCNLKCIMCPQPLSTDHENILNYNLSLIELMNPDKTRTLAITGGEPTLLDDGLFKIIDVCKKYLPKTSLTLLTNGKRFNNLEFTRKLVLINHPDLVIAIPLYSDNDTIHDTIVGVQGSFYETLKGLHNLALFRQKVEIRTVIHALNYERLPMFAEFVYHNLPFATHVALMGMETTGLAEENIKQLWVDPYDYSDQLGKAIQYLHRSNMNISIYNLQLCVLPKKLWTFCRRSISEWKNIFLNECMECLEKNKCCGFFKTSGNYYSQYIRPISY